MTFYAKDRLGFTSGKDTNISGANLRGDEVIGRVGGDLNVASVADTGKVNGKEFDISVTAIFGPAPGLSGSTENHTQIDGALIAADNGNLKLDTGTLGFSDIAGKDKEHGYYLNVGGTYSSGSGTTQGSSQVGKGKEGETGWSVSGWDYQKDREQIVRATVGAGEIVVRKDAETGADSTAGLNRDVSKAYEITKDEESRTDLYASSSSIGAVASPKKAYEQWKKSVELYGEKSRETMVKLSLLLASMGVLIASPDNLQGTSEDINRVLVETENYLKAFSKDENRRAEAIEFRLREQLGDLSSDGEKILLARMKEIVRESPEKSVELTAMISTLRGSPTTAQNYVQGVAYAGVMAALAAALIYPALTPESQERMRNSANSMIKAVSQGVALKKDQIQNQLKVTMTVWEIVTLMPFPVHLLDDENRKLITPIINTSGWNPASGGYAEGGGVITTPHTGGTQLDGAQKDGVYVTPEHKLNPGVMYSESDSSKNTSKNLGSASFDAANGIGTIYSPKVSLSNGEIIFNDFL
ncbi:hemagglutinin repeat-containing protein [Pseudomonas protegens]|nr:hemagglutinin repeat-containing protein [Pseudomonas protegens]MDP9525041.1 hemagglutinin repeat-containing protein [Pseudomonas protegens]